MNYFLIGAVVFGLLLLLRICIWFENKYLNKSNEIISQESSPIKISTDSPYKKKNFTTKDDITQPTNATILALMNHIGLQFDGEPYINGILTHVVVPVIWLSTIEHHYDVRWEKGNSPLKGDIKFDINQFDGYDLTDTSFIIELEHEAMKYLWNYYYKCYPEIFLHYIPNVKTE